MLYEACVEWLGTLSLVFGGCCSHAISLEQVTGQYPHAGSLITLCHFAAISAQGLPQHLHWTSTGPRFKPRRIPIGPYLVQVVLFYFISLLNNAAFAYRIPMSVHIIFRSGGLVVSMILGWLVSGKRYSITQVLSILVVTIGVLLTTLSASSPKSKATDADFSSYSYGIGILSLALLFSGFLGIAQDWTYSKYSQPTPSKDDQIQKSEEKPTEPWQESMFYLHFLALPMFFTVRSGLAEQWAQVQESPRIQAGPIIIPSAYISLAINTFTQVICVAGVNRLTTRVSALTVTLVLVVRKALSLVLSVLGFGSGKSDVNMSMMWAGAALVLLGTIGYASGTGKAKKKDKKE
ncbi:UAA transporter [Pluteus cervinus]|uniref:UAA transporter n=1 Tax=Pluteus cervinus TaxID=181527 RepID=A0ACD3B9Q9_9AGAR|nr:UAA transporter [Pluteus cervinus]